jgi:hypothetical protein
MRVETQLASHRDIAERRKRVRLRLHWRIELLSFGQPIQTTTRDLSSSGFYCWSPVPLAPGSRVVGIIHAPAHSREKPDGMLSIECQVRVARVEAQNPDGFYGLGCEITDYRLIPA